ncbi:hypothetical protein ADUPG1_003241, partial [Aduncisulcus paluster]
MGDAGSRDHGVGLLCRLRDECPHHLRKVTFPGILTGGEGLGAQHYPITGNDHGTIVGVGV